MDYSHLLLSIHIFTGIGLGAALSVTAMSLFKSVSNYYKPLSITLAAMTGVLTVTGVALLVLSSQANVVEFCFNMSIYLSLTAVAEYLLIKNMRQLSAKAEMISE